MTIEQAIEHAERAYKESRNGLQYALKRGETKFAERCKKEAEENRQLAAWLRELQERRKEPKIIHCGECERSEVGGCELYCMEWMRYTSHNGYCHRGAERRTDD